MAVPVRGPSLILDGADCAHLAVPLARYIAEQGRRDGGVPPRLRTLAESVLTTAHAYRTDVLAGSDHGTSGFRPDVVDASCAPSAAWLTVEQTAARLDLSPEYVRRLCRRQTLTSVRTTGRGTWLVDEAAVLELLDARRAKAA
jgi:excisionase family DNA binding protein